MRLVTVKFSLQAPPTVAVAAPNESWIDLAALMDRAPTPVAAWLPWLLENSAEIQTRLAAWRGHTFLLDEVMCLAPIPQPSSFRDFYAFEQHVKTARARRGLEVPPAWYEIPVFYFSNHHAIVGPDAPVFAPAGSQELDYELELGVVIGRAGRDIPVERAWGHVAGFTVLNDFSARDLQRKEVTVGLGPAKAKDFATAIGPVLATLDEFSDRIVGETLALEMTARVNGCERSRGNTSALHHSIPRLIAQASRDADLVPGDLLGTGTVGTGCILELGAENIGGWLKPGDVVELEIERLGVLRTPIVARPGGA
jgi:2-keto-4-pentenoate hydratase/2-oxohepta-3-ene-1,7-dioic acid hydratase in catechol pathway